MEPKTPLRSFSSRSNSSSPVDRKRGSLWPYHELVSEKTVAKIRNPFGHCLYKRVIIWTTISLLLVAFVLFGKHDGYIRDVASSHAGQDSPVLAAVGLDTEHLENIHAEDFDKEETQQKIDATSKDQVQEPLQGTPNENADEPSEEPGKESEADEQSTNQKSDEQSPEKQRKPGPDLPYTPEKSSGKGSGDDSDTSDAKDGSDEDEDHETAKDDIPEYDQHAEESEMKLLLEGENVEQLKQELENLIRMPWLRFPRLNAYFHGLRTLVSKARHDPEYPNPERSAPFVGQVKLNKEVPKPIPYNPYDDSEKLQTCYLDKEKTIPAPTLYAYEGVPRHMPDPAIGSYHIFGIRDDICFDRFGRYGPYGLGYSLAKGGTSVGMNTESSGNEAVWEESGQIDFSAIDWGDAQQRCSDKHWRRFRKIERMTGRAEPPNDTKKSRQAIVVRLYTGFKWTYLAVLNFRALISEVSLKSGGEYTVHFLMHVRDNNAPIWSDDATVQKILASNVPPEFHSMVTLWSEAQMKLYYPGTFSEAIENVSGQDIYGVYRSAHLPLQVFSMQHQEYDHIWNWEMDMRFLGNYYEFFDRLGKWADKQSRLGLWERNARYYIPALHGDWDNFMETVKHQTEESGRQPIFGPLQFIGKSPLRHEQRGESILPASCAVGQDAEECGVGEAADLITLNPLFDAENSGWVFSQDTTGYPTSPPRRCAIITASRLSRRLLAAMHEEMWRHHHSMFSEMFPPSVALHHGFKATYAPHPIYIDRAWSPLGKALDREFNAGPDHSSSGPGSPFAIVNEHNHKGASWYYNSEFSGLLWRRWLGYAQPDGRKTGGGGDENRGKERGGYEEESAEGSLGRMCLRSMLLHPIKFEDPAER